MSVHVDFHTILLSWFWFGPEYRKATLNLCNFKSQWKWYPTVIKNNPRDKLCHYTSDNASKPFTDQDARPWEIFRYERAWLTCERPHPASEMDVGLARENGARHWQAQAPHDGAHQDDGDFRYLRPSWGLRKIGERRPLQGERLLRNARIELDWARLILESYQSLLRLWEVWVRQEYSWVWRLLKSFFQ